jgi:hypothetical protein
MAKSIFALSWTNGKPRAKERYSAKKIHSSLLSREEMTKLGYMAAKIGFGKVNADEIQSTVDSLLTDGIYSDEFIGIMDSKPARLDEVLPSFTTYLQREGISVPTKDQAVWQLIAHHVSRIASGTADPITELQELISDVYWDYDFHTPTREYVGDSHGIEYLIGLYWEYNDMMDRDRNTFQEEIKEIKESIVKRSKEWMERFANKALQRTSQSDAVDL